MSDNDKATEALTAAKEVLDRLARIEAVVANHEAVLRALAEQFNHLATILALQQESIRTVLGMEPKPPAAVN